MSAKGVPINRQTWVQFAESVKNLVGSEVGVKAKIHFSLLITLLFGISGLNVVNSYVGRDFMTAIADREMAEFIWLATLYITVFAASTLVSVFYRFIEERLSLLWREWLTRRAVVRYLEKRTYYYIDTAENSEIANPDQRIAEDIRTLTVNTLSFVLMILNGSITVVAFAGVLWSISPLLFVVSVLYAAVGSFLTVLVGRPLVRLNYDQLDKEANFRTDLIHVRENAESVAMLNREELLRTRLLRHLNDLTVNFRKIITVNRNLSFFTTGYNWLIQIIPALIVAPLFIRGEVEFGVVTQSAMAFSHLLGAFSLVVNQFQSISSYTAVLARLSVLRGEMKERLSPTVASPIEIREQDGRLDFERLTLRSTRDNRTLLKELSVSIPRGMRVLITGPSNTAKAALFRATAGVWDAGEGGISRPSLEDIFFLPERPYFPPGTMRDLLLQTGQEKLISDEQILKVFHRLDLRRMLERAGGLDIEKDWKDLLSLDEQQLLAFARCLLAAPQFAFLDRPHTALSPGQVNQILSMLSEQSISYITLGSTEYKLENYDAVIQLAEGGGWKWQLIQAGRVVEGDLGGER
ncbi:MAG: ABC transporter ATP-binding protein/permease [Gammaproteobacteria bacterium]|nr:ABC transporter ATP-binding protein/permease [Gammaproteobacteria bacterium]